jgi:phycocyanobilin:ferredoxin oxidoreductase
VETNRLVPDWGRAIFSPLCVCMRPSSPAEVGAFLKYAIALSQFHVQIGRLAAPVAADGPEGPAVAARRLAGIRAAHERYCAKQLENDKTRRVLEKAFGAAASEAYMRTVMFDVEGAAAEGGGQ